MSVNIVIGVGGTGAKVAEAIVHATAVGLGPSSLRVGFVDQDRSNGNTTRARSLVTAIVAVRANWRKPGGPHNIATGGPFETDIDFLCPTEIWTPHPDQNATLSRIFGTMPDDKPLFDQFFAQGVIEQDMPLDGGYRGRPHVGSAAITDAMQDQSAPFWRSLNVLLDRAANGESVRLLLAGSVFGGTGAAGFPTIARLIRRHVDARGHGDNVKIGGVLMLPYFGFLPPAAEARGRGENVARADELLMQARGALRYYNILLKEEYLFQDLYLVGWNSLFSLGYHAPESAAQENPALAPELLAAMGSCRFFNGPTEPRTERARVHASTRAEPGRLAWSDLPTPSLGLNDAPYQKFGQALRFATAWKHYRPILGKKPGFIEGFISAQVWYRKQGVNKVDYRHTAPARELAAMDHYIDMFLIWAAMIEAYAVRQGIAFDLWELKLVIESVNFNRPTDPVRVLSEIATDGAMRAAYNAAVVVPGAAAPPPDTAALIEALTHHLAPGKHAGLGQMVASLYAFTAVNDKSGG